MLRALQQTVRAGAGGKIELIAPECPEGADVQVIVLLAPQPEPIGSLSTQALEVDEVERTGQSAIAKIQAMVRRYVPESKSLVDELIGDRRKKF